MMKRRSYPDLEIEEDITFERKNWIAERIAWVLLTVFVLAALLGFFGRGGISNAKAGASSKGIEIKYQRYLRYHTPEKLEIIVFDAGQNGTYSLFLNKDWLQAVQIENIQPQPQSQKATSTGAELVFEVAEGNQPLHFSIFYKPEEMGTVKAAITNHRGAVVTFSQFVYP